jgi:hypothetical protein
MWKEILALSARTRTILLLGVLGLLALMAYIRYAPTAGSRGIGEVVDARAPKAVVKVIERIKRVQVPGPERIVYLEKKGLAAALKMPELEKERGEAVAVAEVQPHIGKTTVVSMLDNTGVTRMILRPEPHPFFQFKKEMGIRAGIGTGGLALGEVYLRPFAVNPRDRGQLNVELRGFAKRTDADGADFGGAVLLDYRF